MTGVDIYFEHRSSTDCATLTAHQCVAVKASLGCFATLEARMEGFSGGTLNFVSILVSFFLNIKIHD
jgi:hypothetical protein